MVKQSVKEAKVFHQRMAAKDMEVAAKYPYDPKFNTGGTFGINYAAMDGHIPAFNYRTICWDQKAQGASPKAYPGPLD